MGPLPRLGVPSYVVASTGGSSTQAGDGALFSSSTTLLGGGITAAPSSLIGAFTSAPSRAESSAILSVIGAAAGCAMGCSVAVCPTVVYLPVTGGVGPKPKMVLGSISEAVLQSSTQALPHWNTNFTKNLAIFS